MSDKAKLLSELNRCVLDMEEEAVVGVAQEYVAAGHDAYDGITEGLAKGMEQAGQLYEEEEYFVPELLLCSDAMYNGLEVLKPHLKTDASQQKCAAIIGVVAGDTHDIGKNLVKIMQETAGFEMHDLGRDVAVETFIAKAREVGTGLLCLSTLLSTTMHNMEKVIRALEDAGLRKQFKVMVGGGPVTQAFADRIGADAYTDNAAEAAKVAQELAAQLDT